VAKSCKKVVQKLSKVVKKLSENKTILAQQNEKKELDKKSKTKIENSEKLRERYEEKRKTLDMMNAQHP
jgi:hypothetical protein